ncbi:MAG: Txe/YoeB family addiction module toxin [Candidatus Saccharimonadales bacterium]
MPNRDIAFTPNGWKDYQYWFDQDKKTLSKVNKLINETCKEPFIGIGKPEPLKESYAGFWSRRIDKQNRLIYSVSDSSIVIVACRFHY